MQERNKHSLRLLAVALFAAVITGGCRGLDGPDGDASVEGEKAPEYAPEILELRSKIFDNTRALRIYLPPGYYDAGNSQRKYPVIYFNDGVLVFRNDRIALGQIANTLIEDGEIPPTIFVGIDNGASTDKTTNPLRDRANEFLPYPDVGPKGTDEPLPPHPQGKRYPEFIVTEVMPIVAMHYHVASGPSNTGIAGYSYGGTAALYTAITSPDIFGKLMIESTPLWMGAKGELMAEIHDAVRWPKQVYIGRGGHETDDPAVNAAGLKNLETLARAIRNASPRTCLKTFTDEAGGHSFTAWKGRLPVALKFLTNNGRCG